MGNSSHHHLIDKLVLVNSVISGGALFPQVIKVIIDKNIQGLSVASFAIIFLNSSVWLVYAFHRNLVALAITSFFTIVSSGVLVGLIVFFG